MKEFDQLFGIKKTHSEAETEFINRVENTLFSAFPDPKYPDYLGYSEYFKYLCTELGKKSQDYYSVTGHYLPISTLTDGRFLDTLRAIAALYKVYRLRNRYFAEQFANRVIELLDMSSIKLGIRWVDGMFYPDPIPEIDQFLIDENLIFLNNFPDAKKDIQIALKNYQQGSTAEILEKCYSALEQVAQNLCNSKQPLHREDLKTTIISKINASQKWKDFLDSFISYANDVRHGKKEGRHELDKNEIESYLFLSLIMIRMIMKKINN
jgi:hypothetical protein